MVTCAATLAIVATSASSSPRGSASIGSYAIALWAMTRAPVASVAALRETSVLFAVLLSSVLLKERFGLQRAGGALLIVAGVVMLRLA